MTEKLFIMPSSQKIIQATTGTVPEASSPATARRQANRSKLSLSVITQAGHVEFVNK
jgi:hypothetical protein